MNPNEQDYRAKLGIKGNDFYSSLLGGKSESSEVRIEKIESQNVEVTSKIETTEIETNRGYVSYDIETNASKDIGNKYTITFP